MTPHKASTAPFFLFSIMSNIMNRGMNRAGYIFMKAPTARVVYADFLRPLMKNHRASTLVNITIVSNFLTASLK